MAIGSWHFVVTQWWSEGAFLKTNKITNNMIWKCHTFLKIFNQNNCSNQKSHKHWYFSTVQSEKGENILACANVCYSKQTTVLFFHYYCAAFTVVFTHFRRSLKFSHPPLWPSDISNLNFKDWHSAPTESTAGATESSVMIHFALDFCSRWRMSFAVNCCVPGISTVPKGKEGEWKNSLNI